jgi:hypothetical protein
MPEWLQYLSAGVLFVGGAIGVHYLRELAKGQAKFDVRLENLATTRAEAGAQKQGELDAINVNLDAIKTHVETTERTTAAIKAEFDESQWRKRELATLLRTKLEEMLFASEEISVFADDEWNLAFEGKTTLKPNPMIKVSVLSSLYFLRLRNHANNVHVAAHELRTLANKVRLLHIREATDTANQKDPEALSTMRAKFLDDYRNLLDQHSAAWNKLRDAQALLLGKSGEVINEIAGQDIGLAVDYTEAFKQLWP